MRRAFMFKRRIHGTDHAAAWCLPLGPTPWIDVRGPQAKGVIVKRIVPTVAVAAALLLPASASAGASKEVVFDHTSGICTSGLTSGTPTDSFAVINTHAGNISAEVAVKGLEPNTTYQVDLVQTPSGESCLQSPGETSLTTNGQGNGNAHWSEPILSGQTGVFAGRPDSYTWWC
jgi:hypothetical protein